jgi:hypothetical protein
MQLGLLRTGLLLLCGVLCGAGGALLLFHQSGGDTSAVVTPPPESLACEAELQQQRERVADLERRISTHGSHNSSEESPAGGAPVEPTVAPSTSEDRDAAVRWRVSAISKFVELSDEQKQQLEDKYREERAAQEEGRDSKAEALETIIGEEKAKEYRQQVQAAFDRVRDEELDKEALWIARKLSLSSDQERSVRSVFLEVDAQIEREFGDAQKGTASSPQQRVIRMIAENRRRLELRSEALQKILSPEQHEAYVQTEAQSASADVEVFHGP